MVPFKAKLSPSNGWAMPYVTGHKYRVHWAEGLDFESMRMEVSDQWEIDDLNVYFNMNFTETREAINFTTNYKGSNHEQLMNETLYQKLTADLETGDNIVFNDTETREFQFVVNGKNADKRKILLEGLRCISGTCPLDEIEEVELEAGQRLWSDPESWGEQGLPVDGDDVEIMSGWNMVLDLAETPNLNSLTINGRLQFMQNGTDVHLKSRQIFVRAGEFWIGSEEKPFESQATITLLGNQDDETLVLSGTVSAGNKILATTNSVKFVGAARD